LRAGHGLNHTRFRVTWGLFAKIYFWTYLSRSQAAPICRATADRFCSRSRFETASVLTERPAPPMHQFLRQRLLARARAVEDHSRVNAQDRSPSNILSRRARVRRLRVVFLALMLVLANTFAPWAMAFGAATAAHGASHHCHDDASSKKPVQGSTCPCCDHGCQCSTGTAAPLPKFPSMRPLAPDVAIVARDSSAPANPPIAEQLRPPIA